MKDNSTVCFRHLLECKNPCHSVANLRILGPANIGMVYLKILYNYIIAFLQYMCNNYLLTRLMFVNDGS